MIQITPVMRISTGFLGPLAVKTNLHKQTVTVGTVEEPVEISRDGKIETVRVGSDQAVGALTIRESVAGQMNRPILVVSPKGTAISLSRTRVDLISGDVRIGRLSRNAPNVMKIPIRSSSTRPSVIRVELVLYIRGHASTVIRIGSNVSDQLIPVGRLKKPAAYRRWRSSRQVRRFWRRLRELRPWRWWR